LSYLRPSIDWKHRNLPKTNLSYGREKKPRFTYRCLEARRAGSPNVSPAREGWVSHPSR
jgi:hypothetical protein